MPTVVRRALYLTRGPVSLLLLAGAMQIDKGASALCISPAGAASLTQVI